MPTNKEDVSLVRELAKILKETDLTEVEVADGDKRFRVKREVTVAAPTVVHHAPMAAAVPAAAAPAASDNATAPAVSAEGTLASPMVGTAYLANKPGDPPFVKPGDSVKEGQTVLIIEAMKVMNPIKAHKSGKVADVLIKDAQPVEFGQALLVIA